MVKSSALQKVFFLFAMVCFGLIFFINVFDFMIKFLPQCFELFKKIDHKIYLIYLIFIVAIAFLVIFFMVKKVKVKGTLKINNPIIIGAMIFLLSLATKLIFVFVVKMEQYSDYKLFYWVTTEIGKNIPKYLDSSYFGIWAYQVGFPTAMSPLIKIFGENIMPLIVANCVFLSVTNVVIYLITRQFAQERISRICAILYAFLPFIFGLSTVYTNQHLASMLFYIGLFILLYKKSFSIVRALIAGCLFALGNMIRPEGITIILALVAFIVLISLDKMSFNASSMKSNFKKIFIPIICSVLMFFIGNGIINQTIISTGINPYGLANNFPLYKFVVGLNQDTSGAFSKEDADYLFSSEVFIENPKLRDQEAIKIIKERVSVGPKRLITLFSKKARIMWSCAPQGYASFLTFDFDGTVKLLSITVPFRLLLYAFTFIDFIFFIVLFGMCTLSMFLLYKAKENSSVLICLTMLFMVIFFLYFFIEVQHRYSYFSFPALFILSAPGLERILELFNRRRRRTNDSTRTM